MLIGTRLGLLYSWKTKYIINVKTQFLELFKREQAYNRYNYFFVFGKNNLKNNQLLQGNYSKIYRFIQIDHNYLYYYMYTAFERVRLKY